MVIAGPGNIRPVKIEEEMRSSYLDYAMSVIVSRALPDVRDGLKPVHRRILYAMHEMGVGPNSPYRKSARIVGEVMGKYHPHGDAPVYESLVRMAQHFSMRYPLVDGQGNFGSVDDDPPAAMRYTEARLARISQEMLVDIERETVAFTPNFDDSLQEPTVLPARLPSLLVNGATGIAVGMTTSVPPHNLREVCDATCHLIDHSEATVEELMAFIKGPDFPTAGIVRGMGGVREAYYTGRGRLTVEARYDIQEGRRGERQRIVITEIPYQVIKSALVEKIAQLAKDKVVQGIAEVRDESDREGLRVVVELSRGAQGEYVVNNLLKHTAMRSTFFVNMLALVDGQPRVVGLKSYLNHYIDFRRTVVRRRSEYDLKKAQERAHVLEGLRVALANLDAVVQLIRNARDVETARTGLMQQFGLTEVQAQAILDMQLRRLAALEREKIEEEYRELREKIAGLEALLADPQKVLAVVKEETQKLREDFGDDRRTEIVADEATDPTLEERTPHEDVVVTLSNRGYVKRIPFATYRLQHRGGKGSRGQETREGDAIRQLLLADTHDTLLFFTTRGRVYAQRCFHLQADTSKSTRGTPLINVINIPETDQVNAVVAVPSLSGSYYLALATRRGEVKRLNLSDLANIRSNGLNAMDLAGGDELVSARLCQESDDLIILTRMGQGVRFPVRQLTVRSRQAGGVRGIRLDKGDQVIAMDVVVRGAKLLLLTELGFGKLTPLERFRRQSRGGMGVRAFRIKDSTGPLAAAQVVVDAATDLIIGSLKAMVFRTRLDEISTQGRLAKGVSVVKLAPGDRVVSVACLNEQGNGSSTRAMAETSPVPQGDGRKTEQAIQLSLEEPPAEEEEEEAPEKDSE
ncbi:MAG: DNA gyrase subunit A [Chloroflexi bacterium]|nr:DNA gyrase subunit A [Chloroflexota bacterium]